MDSCLAASADLASDSDSTLPPLISSKHSAGAEGEAISSSSWLRPEIAGGAGGESKYSWSPLNSLQPGQIQSSSSLSSSAMPDSSSPTQSVCRWVPHLSHTISCNRN